MGIEPGLAMCKASAFTSSLRPLKSWLNPGAVFDFIFLLFASALSGEYWPVRGGVILVAQL